MRGSDPPSRRGARGRARPGYCWTYWHFAADLGQHPDRHPPPAAPRQMSRLTPAGRLHSRRPAPARPTGIRPAGCAATSGDSRSMPLAARLYPSQGRTCALHVYPRCFPPAAARGCAPVKASTTGPAPLLGDAFDSGRIVGLTQGEMPLTRIGDRFDQRACGCADHSSVHRADRGRSRDRGLPLAAEQR